MFRKTGHYIGDAWYHIEGDTAHMFYLTRPDSIPRHTHWSIGHAHSTDLINWQDHGIILTPGDSQAWDGICPATGSVLKVKDRYWMAYTGMAARYPQLALRYPMTSTTGPNMKPIQY